MAIELALGTSTTESEDVEDEDDTTDIGDAAAAADGIYARLVATGNATDRASANGWRYFDPHHYDLATLLPWIKRSDITLPTPLIEFEVSDMDAVPSAVVIASAQKAQERVSLSATGENLDQSDGVPVASRARLTFDAVTGELTQIRRADKMLYRLDTADLSPKRSA